MIIERPSAPFQCQIKGSNRFVSLSKISFKQETYNRIYSRSIDDRITMEDLPDPSASNPRVSRIHRLLSSMNSSPSQDRIGPSPKSSSYKPVFKKITKKSFKLPERGQQASISESVIRIKPPLIVRNYSREASKEKSTILDVPQEEKTIKDTLEKGENEKIEVDSEYYGNYLARLKGEKEDTLELNHDINFNIMQLKRKISKSSLYIENRLKHKLTSSVDICDIMDSNKHINIKKPFAPSKSILRFKNLNVTSENSITRDTKLSKKYIFHPQTTKTDSLSKKVRFSQNMKVRLYPKELTSINHIPQSNRVE